MNGQHRLISIPSSIRVMAICLILAALSLNRTAVSASTPLDSSNGTDTSTVLVVDTSGSMDDLLSTGESKLSAAKNAGRKLLDIIGAENEAGISADHEVAIVDFSDIATVDRGFTSDFESAQSALSSLYTTGGTSMPKGLRAALDLFPSTLTAKSFIILLSDGQPNIGLNDEDDAEIVRQQVLDLAKEAGQREICVYTVGFGDPDSGLIDEQFLSNVALQSGCGEYHNVQNAWELANIYIKLRHESTGQTLLEKSGEIKQDETLPLGDAQVPDNQSMILFTLNWPGSRLDAIIKDPRGNLVDQSYPGAFFTTTDTLVSVIIQDPLPGNWNIAAYGANVPESLTPYSMTLSARTNPNPPTPLPVAGPIEPAPTPATPSFPFVIITIILGAVGVVVYMMTLSTRRARLAASIIGGPAMLTGITGSFVGHRIPAKDGILIGRAVTCAVRMTDPNVSRIHARLSFARGRWYIQDMNSHSGVYVNGARVQTMMLNRGDRIRIGSTEFEFR